jgi:hypothetical protein
MRCRYLLVVVVGAHPEGCTALGARLVVPAMEVEPEVAPCAQQQHVGRVADLEWGSGRDGTRITDMITHTHGGVMIRACSPCSGAHPC